MGNSEESIIENYRSETISLLSEIYQIACKNGNQYHNTDVSVELVWLSEKTEEQTYEAKIRFFVVARAIGVRHSQTIANTTISIIKSRLNLLQYRTQEMDYETFVKFLGDNSFDYTTALVKQERIENLGNNLLPACYAFERFDSVTTDFASLVDIMSHNPGVYLSISLIPTNLKQEEMQTVQQLSQTLDTLRNGIYAGGMGNLSVAAADEYAELYRYYYDNKNSAFFEYTIAASGSQSAVNSVISTLTSSFIRKNGRNTSLRAKTFTSYELDIHKEIHAYPWILQQMTPSATNKAFKSLQRLPHLVTGEEASLLFRLPIGSRTVAAGLTINESERISKTYSSGVINAGDIELGVLKATGSDDFIGIKVQDLAKHLLIVGTPGSGKTTFSVGLLDRLWKEEHIPFLVIEPAKHEYRALIQSIPELQVFTPGKNTISPFVFNPFVPPKNVKLETYKSTLKTAFAAGVSMTSPLDKIFEEAINNCYADYRWLDTYTSDGKGEVFNISDFIKCFKDTFDEIGYTGDAKNIGRAGTVRLKSLINLFDNYYSIPIEDMMEKPTVIELAAIENAEQKSLIIALVLLSILAYVNSNYLGEGGLRNFILLEEAHVLLAERGNNNSDTSPSEIAQDLFKRMLAELRSYGVGIGIADQSPRKVTSDVVALTDMKVVFRLVESVDKQIISDSMNMTESQAQRLGRLKPGEAFFFFSRLDEPEEIMTPDYRMDNSISISLSDEGIKKQVSYWKNKQKDLRPYPECRLINPCRDDCDYETRLLGREIARRLIAKNFKSDDDSFEALKTTLGSISALVRSELNGEELTNRLLGCVKCHLWRKIARETKIPIRQIQIENSLKKV